MLSTATAGTFTYTFTPTAGQCASTITSTVVVANSDNATFNYTSPVYCIDDPNPLPSITGLTNGTFTIAPTGTINPSTGQINLSATGQGNYTITYNTNGPCPNTAIYAITINNVTPVTINPVDVLCTSDGAFSLIASVPGGIWQGDGILNSASGLFDPSQAGAGTHTITYQLPGNCAGTATITVTVNTINANITPNSTTISEGESIVLTASGGISYTWSPSNGLSCDDCAVPTASPLTSTIYTVTATDASGCQGEADVLITVIPVCGEVFVPTVLSPNGAQQDDNKMACVYGNCIVTMNYSIYNRWGEKVFETQDPSNCWDGKYKRKEMNPGVYAYKLEATLLNGQIIEQSGNITLLK